MLISEYTAHGIRANCVCPGAIDTPLLQRSFGIPGFADASAPRSRWADSWAAGGDGEVVLSWASDLASDVTGAAVVADGGLTAKTGIPTRFTD